MFNAGCCGTGHVVACRSKQLASYLIAREAQLAAVCREGEDLLAPALLDVAKHDPGHVCETAEASMKSS